MLLCLALLCSVVLTASSHAIPSVIPPRAVNNGKIITPEFSHFVQNVMQRLDTPGLSLAISRYGGTPEVGAWGHRTEDGDPVTPDTLFHLASCSKAFLSSALGVLIDDYAQRRNNTPLPQGLLEFSWDTKIKDLLPGEWELMDEWASEKANLRDILSHVSGLPRHDFSYSRSDSLQDVAKRMKYLKPESELRQRYSYNNQMYMIGARIIALYTGGTYTSFVESRILGQLGMASSTMSPKRAASSGHLSQNWDISGRRIPEWITEDTKELLSGEGGVISSANDMVRWMDTLLGYGIDPHTGRTIIPGFNQTITAQSILTAIPEIPESSIVAYALGWGTFSLYGHNILQHVGEVPGFTTAVYVLPSDGLALTVLVNASPQEAATGLLALRILYDVLGVGQPIEVANKRAFFDKRDAADTSNNSSSPTLLDAYAGSYTNPGYGNLTLCSPTSPAQFPFCDTVLSTFSSIEDPLSSPPKLYASWPRFWSSHLRITHLSDTQFGLEPTTVFPQGYGRNQSAFELSFGPTPAEFGFDEKGEVQGLAVFGLRKRTEEQAREDEGKGLEEKADVWFVKV